MNSQYRKQWIPYKLNELGSVGRGRSRHRPRNAPELYGGDYPFIQTAEVTASEFYITSYSRTYSELGLAQSKMWNKDTLCIVNAGENTAETAILKFNACFPDSIIGFIANPQKADVRFIKYYLTTIKEQLRSITKGATQDNLSVDKLLSFDILTPPLPTQKKIAAILSAYDNLIENNTRRIKILEEMAQTLYHEWFVKFRFPGHKHTKMVDSELGLIPEGWEVVSIRDVSVYMNRGIAPKYDEQSESIVINQKCIRDNRINLELARRHSKKVPEEKFLQFGDILINSTGIGTLGRVAQVYQKISDCTVDSHVSIVRPADCVNIDYFGFALIQLQPYFDHMGVGSTGQTELSRQSIGDTNFLLPPKNLQETFSQAVSPMRHAMIGMFAKNSKLRQTRDLLLPKLISGEIDVEHLEITTEDIAA
ncbi:MAG: restriction endonuclease subunit S [Hassallia sp. WJT32-NPBG1]|jgi:type I restriction enzyme S subunit|nr:restriction endonuclease subunit S [Hassallia sp. WJT32-NPBG1]